MTNDKYKAGLDIANATAEEVKELDFGNVFWACGVLAQEAEQLRKERDELAKAVVALDANLIHDNEVIFKKRGMRQHSQVDHKSTIELAKKVSERNGNA